MACNNTDPSALRDQGATLQRLFIHLYRYIQFHSTKSHSHVDNWRITMTTIEQSKCTVGFTQYYCTTEIIEDQFVEYTHTVVTARVLTIKQAAGEAIITHTGGYGRKKFIFNNIEFTTESGTRKGKEAIAIGTDGTCINYTDVVFDREDWGDMHDSFIFRRDKTGFWLDITEEKDCNVPEQEIE